ncbi:hypothetical protein KKH59_02040 [Patescibacteria group bacterium]|nr:hypothetical protein [Patescibacteria group bacterium]
MPFIFTASKNSFEGQLSGEKTVLATRKHWFVLFFSFWAFIFFGFFAFFDLFFEQ